MKKLMAFICVVCILSSLLAGCNSDDESVANAEVVDLLWYVPGDAQPDQKAVMKEVNKILNEKIGVNLTIQFIPTSAYSERMKMIMASGTKYDLCFTSNWINYYTQAADNGALYDVTDLIDEDILEVVPADVIEGAKINERLYAVPNMQILAQPLAVWARSDLLEKYNFDLQSVEHINDIEPFLKMVQEGEDGIYPIRTKWGGTFWINKDWSEMKAVGLYFNYKTHELKPMYDIPEYKNHVETFRRWYKEGYIRKDIASAGDDTTDSKQGRYAVEMSSYKPGQTSPSESNMYKYDYKVLFTLPMTESAGCAAMTGISTTSKHPEKAFELIKLMNTDKKLYNLVCNGIEGKHYKLTKEGKIISDPKKGYYPDRDWVFGCQFNALVDDGTADDVWEKTIEINKSVPASPLSGFTYDDSETAIEISNILAVRDEYDDYISVKDYDAFLKEYKAELKEAGIDKVYADIEKQVKAFLDKKGIKPEGQSR